MNSEISKEFPTESGVPQGCVLGPFSYNRFMSDITTILSTNTAAIVDDNTILPCDNNPKMSPNIFN